MSAIKFVASTRAGAPGELFINGVKVGGVIDISPDLFARDSLSTVTLTIAVESFEYVKEVKE